MAIRRFSTSNIRTGRKSSKFWDQASAYSDMELVTSSVLSSDQSTVSFTSLNTVAAAYKHLILMANIQDSGAGAGSSLLLKINGDTGSNYNVAAWYGGGTSIATWSYFATNTPYCGSSFGYLNEANSFSIQEYVFCDFAATDKFKHTINTFGVQKGDATNGYYGQNYHEWKSTNAITSFSLEVPSYNIKAGSAFYLYGLKG